MFLFFFFFQAEDGIRDHCVTGVQTCALPILRSRPAPPLGETQRERRTQQCHGCPHEPAPPSRHAGEAQREARASQPGFQGEEAGHFLRNACNAARKSGVVRLTAFTSAPSRIPSSKRTPSSW